MSTETDTQVVAEVRENFGKGYARRVRANDKIPAVIYGAGPRTVLESNAKRADEHLVLEDLRRATQVIARSLLDLLQRPA